MPSERPRLLFVSHQASRTGAPMMLLHLLRWLRANTDLRFEILLLRRGPLEAAFRDVATVHHIDRTRAGMLADVLERGLYRVGLGAVGGRLKGLRYRYRLWRLGRFDLVYLNAALSFSMVRYFPPASRRAVIGHLHELEMGLRASLPRGRPLSELLPLIHRVIVCADVVGSQLLRSHDLPEGVRRHYEFIDLPPPADDGTVAALRRELAIPEGALVVGNVATVEWRKGTDLFAQLAALVSRRFDAPVVFVWVGATGHERDFPFVDHDLRHAGVQPLVRWVEPVDDVSPYHRLFDVLALTSREDPFPLVCLEAAAQRTPVVAFEGGGGIPEFLLPDRGIVVPFLDVSAMADEVVSLLRDGDRRAALGARAEAKVREDHAVEAVAPRIHEEISDLLRERAALRR